MINTTPMDGASPLFKSEIVIVYAIALKMLLGDRLKYFGLIAGIAFAAMLIAQQASILVGFTKQTGAFIRDTAQADLWIMDPQVRFSQDHIPLREIMVHTVRGTPGVQWAVPLFQGFVRARMPDGTNFTLILVGLDDSSLTGAPPLMVEGALTDLRRDRAVFIDAGTSAKKLRMKNGGNRPMQVGDTFSIMDHQAYIAGSYRSRTSFFWEPVLYTTYSRALTFAAGGDRNLLSYVMVKLLPDASLEQTRALLQQRTGLAARTNEEFIQLTADYILNETGILMNFGFAILLGFAIGSLVAGQTFYNFTLDNLRHYGTLKAMGVSNRTLAGMLFLQVAVVSVLGYGIGVGMGSALGLLMSSAGLAFSMPWQIPAITALAILLVSLLASWFSLRRVFALEPAVVFKG
ncbi:ABC transporter permease [Candidatus Magnetaquicoccus inordinatus]|uniref:ABC transporter permease n=1 Tax=Candidatus Magnetaquicoccus inordinatus TaxID=2496818 RepID=UPI00102BF47E|nr:ABC transporter permease [Candidatus Magnetaquicoccus inordinatus]